MSFVGNIIIVTCSFISFFLIGWRYIANQLLSNVDPSFKVAKVLLNITFTISCCLFELILFEILDILDDQFRWFFWKLNLHMMLILIMFIFPFYQCYILCRCQGFHKTRELWIACLLYVSYLIGFWLLCIYPFPNLVGENTSLFSLSSGISRVGIAGVTLIACFSGFGLIAFPATHIRWFMHWVSPSELNTLERNLTRTLKDIVERKKRLVLKTEEEPQTGFIQRMVSRISNKDDLWNLQNEIKGLEIFAETQYAEYCELKREEERLMLSYDTKGEIYNIVGYLFSVYGLYKIITSLINIVFGRSDRGDPITFILDFVHFNIDVSFWTQMISLFLIGIMISLTIRGLIKKIFKLFSELSAFVSPVNITLFLSQLMGMYFVSSILLLRSTLPVPYRSIITHVLSDIRFEFYHQWFDIMFVLTATATLLSVIIRGRSSVIESSLN